MSVIAENEQSVLDLSVQTTGTVEASFEVAVNNGLSITDKPGVIAGTAATANADILNFYNNKSLKPVSNVSETMTGIGYWEIENDFEVQ